MSAFRNNVFIDLSKCRCQESNMLGFCIDGEPIPCGRPGAKVIFHQNDGRNVYVMCEGCADHNVRNRGGVELVQKTECEAIEENFCIRCEMRLAKDGGDYCAVCDDRMKTPKVLKNPSYSHKG